MKFIENFPIRRGIIMKSPGPLYGGGGFFYFDKFGRFRISNKMPKKSEVMSDVYFYKKFGIRAIRNTKRRKNPVDDFFMNKLIMAVTYNRPYELSKALIYKKMGFTLCDACEKSFNECTCEGSRNFKIKPWGERIHEPCEECKLNYCLCGYEIETFYDLLKIVLEFVKEFNKEQLTTFYKLAIKQRREVIYSLERVKELNILNETPVKDRKIWEKQSLGYLKNINILLKSLSH